MRRLVPAFALLWMSGCSNQHTSGPFMPTGMPPMEDAGPPVTGGPPVGSVANDAGADMAGADMRHADMGVADMRHATDMGRTPMDMDPPPDMARDPAGPWPLTDVTNYGPAQ